MNTDEHGYFLDWNWNRRADEDGIVPLGKAAPVSVQEKSVFIRVHPCRSLWVAPLSAARALTQRRHR
jgi:hypothetical protein